MAPIPLGIEAGPVGKEGNGGGPVQWPGSHVCVVGVRGRGPDNQVWTYHGRRGKGSYTSYEALDLGLGSDLGQGLQSGKKGVGAGAEVRVEVEAEGGVEAEVEKGWRHLLGR